MARIYVSASFEDLKEQRLCVVRVLRDLGHVPVCMEKYHASERPPLAVCLSDVESCQGYVGLFAFRYGSLAQPEGRSFTHLEYEKAVACGIPTLLFFLRAEAPWSAARIDDDKRTILDLRAKLALKHLVREFSNLEELAREVRSAVREKLGEGRRIPELLPYRCDCSEQEWALDAALRRRRPRRPLVCIVHGDDQQGHRMFLSRLQNDVLHDFLGLPMETGIQSYNMIWPDSLAEAETEKLLFKLSSQIPPGRRTISRAEVQQRLSSLRIPVMVYSRMLTKIWLDCGAEVLDRFLGFWQDWPELEPGQHLLVFLLIQYQRKEDFPPERRAPYVACNATIESRLQELDGTGFPGFDRIDGAVLPPLAGVTLQNALDWAESDDLRSFAPSDRMARDLVELFSQWERDENGAEKIPLAEFALRMREDLLPRYEFPAER